MLFGHEHEANLAKLQCKLQNRCFKDIIWASWHGIEMLEIDSVLTKRMCEEVRQQTID
jgi:hypothetical protein